MNFSAYFNTRVYQECVQTPSLAFGEKRGMYDDSVTVDMEDADFNTDLNDPEKIRQLDEELGMYRHARLGEILEHLVYDYRVLRLVYDHLTNDGTMLVTVPFLGEADYHVRLHNRWSIEQLLKTAGFSVTRYIPRKAQRFDRFIAYVRGALSVIGVRKVAVNAFFYRINDALPFQPNGGFFLCKKSVAYELSEVNRNRFRTQVRVSRD